MNFQVSLGLVDQPVTKHVRNNLLLCHHYGAEMMYFNSVLKALVHYYVIERVRRPGAYFIPMGGSSPLGTLGYVNAGLELAMQLERNELPLPQAIFVAAGTCGTMAGLLLGLKLAKVETRIMGVQVAPGLFTNKKALLNLIRRTLRLMRRHDKSVPAVSICPDEIIIEEGHLGQGYGHPTDAARSALTFLAETEGIPLDLTYTAKAFGALLKYIKDEPEKEPVLFWNTFNSVDLSSICNGVEYLSLPKGFHRFFEDNQFAQ
jgi:D-cysteine desulfhydrase